MDTLGTSEFLEPGEAAPAKKKKKAKPKTKVKKPSKAVTPTHRIDLRLPIAIKKKLWKAAKAKRRTITSVMVELIEKMR